MLPAWVTGLAAGLGFLYIFQKLFLPYFWVDLKYLLKVMKYGLTVEASYLLRRRLSTVLDRFVVLAKKQPHKPFIVYEGYVHTYRAVDRRSNRIAQLFLRDGSLTKGDTVALLMSNEPDFVHVWFGLAKLGCVVAFLNCNIRSRSLLHCIGSCAPKSLVVGTGTVDAWLLPILGLIALPFFPEGLNLLWNHVVKLFIAFPLEEGHQGLHTAHSSG